MGDKQVVSYLETAQAEHPSLAPQFESFADLYKRRLWHQLTVAIEEAIKSDDFCNGSVMIPFYNEFVSTFGHKLNLLKLAHIAVTVAQQHDSPQEAVQFLETVVERLMEAKLARSEQPLLFLRLHLAQYRLQLGEVAECAKAVEAGKEELDSLRDVDPAVSAIVHYVSSQYYKQKKNFAEFYKSSLLYLAFVSSESLPVDLKRSLAVDISLAALLGENIYNFGELLLHPIMEVLDDSPYAWLKEVLLAFNAGDLARYDILCVRHADALNSQPALVAHERRLREKITILCLMELIFSLPAEQRTVSLATIGQRTKLEADGVEFLIMKTLSLKLIAAVIDQVDATLQARLVSWVQPRVLTMEQTGALKMRLDTWISKVSSATHALQQEQLAVLA